MALTLAASMTLGLCACGSQGEQTTAAAESAETTAAASAEETSAEASGSETGETGANGDQVTLSISWWGGDSRHEATLAALELFEEKYPNIKVEPQYGAWGSCLYRWPEIPSRMLCRSTGTGSMSFLQTATDLPI